MILADTKAATCLQDQNKGSPFYNNFVFVHLRPFSRAEAEALFDQMLTSSGILFAQAEKDYIPELLKDECV